MAVHSGGRGLRTDCGWQRRMARQGRLQHVELAAAASEGDHGQAVTDAWGVKSCSRQDWREHYNLISARINRLRSSDRMRALLAGGGFAGIRGRRMYNRAPVVRMADRGHRYSTIPGARKHVWRCSSACISRHDAGDPGDAQAVIYLSVGRSPMSDLKAWEK